MRSPAPAFFFCLGIFLGVLLDGDAAASSFGPADEAAALDGASPVGIGPRPPLVGMGPIPGTPPPRPVLGTAPGKGIIPGRGPIIIGMGWTCVEGVGKKRHGEKEAGGGGREGRKKKEKRDEKKI